LIFITAKFPVKPEHADSWADITKDFTTATNEEDGCVFFEWSRSLEDPNTYVLVEAFRDDQAGTTHVQSDHFKRATSELPAYLAATPDIINVRVDGWSKLGEMTVN
jgi:quinol monooxygenase YgiN